MKSFILKHKHRIIYWSILLFLLLYFAPRQNEFYPDADIQLFKKQFITPFLIYTWIAISIALCIILLYRTSSILNSFASLIYGSIISACLLFIFQGLFLAAALFLNRQYSKKTVTRTYVVYKLDEKSRYFIFYDDSTGKGLLDGKLNRRIDRSGLKQKDTVHFTFKKGLFGIPYFN
jgi:hypothetical protein